ncbi:MAG: hypothetical protein ABII27_04280 [bacterium]
MMYCMKRSIVLALCVALNVPSLPLFAEQHQAGQYLAPPVSRSFAWDDAFEIKHAYKLEEPLNKIIANIKSIDSKFIKALKDNEIFSVKTEIQKLIEIDSEIGSFKQTPENQGNFDAMLVRRSKLARSIAGMLLEKAEEDVEYKSILSKLADLSMEKMYALLDQRVANKDSSETKANSQKANLKRFINEWLEPKNSIPKNIVQGFYRGVLESRWDDIIYAYGMGYKTFGTAGIRNQAVYAKYRAILKLELEEFKNDVRAPILSGPNMINPVTLLQQVASISKLYEDYQIQLYNLIEQNKKLKEAAKELGIDMEFADNLGRGSVTIAFDSRLNGDYFAYLLATAYLKNGLKVNLFDAPAGVPAGAAASKGWRFFGRSRIIRVAVKTFNFRILGFLNVGGSALGNLISASHSEANYNGFKAFVGHWMSQVPAFVKDLIAKRYRNEVTYEDMKLELVDMDMKDFRNVFRQNRSNVRWLGDRNEKENFDYCGAKFTPFYPLYYDHLVRQSPIPYRKLTREEKRKIKEAKSNLPLLYSAFYGVGSIPGANLPLFFKMMGYNNFEIVKQQTENMDGTFPGHDMPDPGVVEGWMSNINDYINQHGTDLEGFKRGVNALEGKIPAATDPDADRYGNALPTSINGNMKNTFIEWWKRNVYEPELAKGGDEAILKAKEEYLKENMQDFRLLTANDAWAMLLFYRLLMQARAGVLDKNKIYIMIESHVTTEMLEDIASYFRKTYGLNIYVGKTWVGYTEIADLTRKYFDIARSAQSLYRLLLAEKYLSWLLPSKMLDAAISKSEAKFKECNSLLKDNVPYQEAGLDIIDDAILSLDEGNYTAAIKKIKSIREIEIACGIEESNGYGKLGRVGPHSGKIRDFHISEKDGGLAFFEFAEIYSFAKAIWNKEPYELFTNMIEKLGGYMGSENLYTRYPGAEGEEQKFNTVENLEKVFSLWVQKLKDMGEEVVFTINNENYSIDDILIYRAGKYDIFYKGLPEEGVRLILVNKKTKDKIKVTLRPSGTGDSNRDYNWLQGLIEGRDVNEFIKHMDESMENITRDFFGRFGMETERIVSEGNATSEANGFLLKMKTAGSAAHELVFEEVLGKNPFSEFDKLLLKNAKTHAYALRDISRLTKDEQEREVLKAREAQLENDRLWTNYLKTEEARNNPKQFNFSLGDAVNINMPNCFVKPLIISVCSFIAREMVMLGISSDQVTTSDREVTEMVQKLYDEEKENMRFQNPREVEKIKKGSQIEDSL